MTDAPLPPLPVTVIAGYLGAGKTSLVNHLLRNPQGRRLMVMVNDFGELNIDADLLESADEDTLTLSNGCICCTMGTELLYALGEAIDRRPRPDHLVIEASGVAQPEKIAAAAQAEPEMRYAGIITLADAANLPEVAADRLIGAQIRAQLTHADLIALTKTDLADRAAAEAVIRAETNAPIIEAAHGVVDIDLILGHASPAPVATTHAHDHGAAYASWSAKGGVVDPDRLKALLKVPPPGLYRFKGVLRTAEGAVEAHVVGRTWDMRAVAPQDTAAVAIGPAESFAPDAMQAAWEQLLI